MSTESGAPAGNNAAPANAPPLVETSGDPQAVRFELELDAETAGPSASKPPNPVDSVVVK